MKTLKTKSLKMKAMVMAMAGMATFTSCGTSKATLADIDGEWIITEAGGKAINANGDGEKPFIGFSIGEGRVYGYAGCNRMTGSIGKDLKPGKLDLSRMGSTKMMCPDIETEDLIMSQMAKTDSYKKMGSNKVALCDADGNKVMILERKGK